MTDVLKVIKKCSKN